MRSRACSSLKAGSSSPSTEGHLISRSESGRGDLLHSGRNSQAAATWTDIPELLRKSGFEIPRLDSAYIAGPKLVSFHFVGAARPLSR